jgi:GR25 family glycosyltransferase involved in LPS biosynthesis
MEYIDHIYYINLDHRTDRREQFEKEMRSWGVPEEKLTRISGIYKKELGILGCGLSHKKTMETFLASPYKNCIIFEDDFTFTLGFEEVEMMLSGIFKEQIPFDVVMFAGEVHLSQATRYHFLRRLYDGNTASAYMITRKMAQYILEVLEESTTLLDKYFKEHGTTNQSYHNDIYWKRLQPWYAWFITEPRWGIQRESYSDNLMRNLKYGF